MQQTGRMRPLTAAELAMFEGYLPGHGLALPRVRFCDGHGRHPAAVAAFRKGNTAITLGRTVYFGPGRYCDDYAAQPARHELFMHEMTHVWQWHRLGALRFLARYARDLVKVRGRARLMYRYEKGVDRFADAMIEAQAQMVGDYAGSLARGDGAEKALLARNLAGSGFYGL